MLWQIVSECAKDVKNRGNELRDLLETKDLAFFRVKNELNFDCKYARIEPKKRVPGALFRRPAAQERLQWGWGTDIGTLQRPFHFMHVGPTCILPSTEQYLPQAERRSALQDPAAHVSPQRHSAENH